MSNIYKNVLGVFLAVGTVLATLFIYNKANEKPIPAVEVKKFSQKDLDSVVNKAITDKTLKEKLERENKELEARLADTLEKKNKLIREWKSLVTVKSSTTETNRPLFGGFDKIKITVSNQSDFTLSSAMICLGIYSGDGKLCSQPFLHFDRIGPGNQQETEFSFIDCGRTLRASVFEANFKEIDLKLRY